MVGVRHRGGFKAHKSLWLDEAQHFFTEAQPISMKRFETDPTYRQEIQSYISIRMMVDGQ